MTHGLEDLATRPGHQAAKLGYSYDWRTDRGSRSVFIKFITVTPGFKGKSECIEHMCARIKFHTCVDSVYTKTQCKNVKRV
jgi:hypothetical protein